MMISVLLHDELNHPPKEIGSEYRPRLPSDSNVKKKKNQPQQQKKFWIPSPSFFVFCWPARDNEDVWFGGGMRADKERS